MRMQRGGVFALALLAAGGVSAVPAFAADADHPFRNVDKKVDAGNNTGDDQVDTLNGQQLQPPPGAAQAPTQVSAMPVNPPSVPAIPTAAPLSTTTSTTTTTTTTGAPPNS